MGHSFIRFISRKKLQNSNQLYNSFVRHVNSRIMDRKYYINRKDLDSNYRIFMWIQGNLFYICMSSADLSHWHEYITVHPRTVHPETVHPWKIHPESVHPQRQFVLRQFILKDSSSSVTVRPETVHPEKIHPETVHPEKIHPQDELSLRMNCHSGWTVFEDELSLRMNCHWGWTVTQDEPSLRMNCLWGWTVLSDTSYSKYKKKIRN